MRICPVPSEAAQHRARWFNTGAPYVKKPSRNPNGEDVIPINNTLFENNLTRDPDNYAAQIRKNPICEIPQLYFLNSSFIFGLQLQT